LGFRVQGPGFRVQGVGFRVQTLGFGVQGSGFRVQGSGFRVLGFRLQASGLRENSWKGFHVKKQMVVSSAFISDRSQQAVRSVVCVRLKPLLPPARPPYRVTSIMTKRPPLLPCSGSIYRWPYCVPRGGVAPFERGTPAHAGVTCAWRHKV